MGVLLPDEVWVVSYFVWRRLGEEVPLAEIALSYKKNLYRKVNYSKSAIAVSVTIRMCSVPMGIWRRSVGQAQPTMLRCQQVLPELIQMRLLCHQDRPPQRGQIIAFHA